MTLKRLMGFFVDFHGTLFSIREEFLTQRTPRPQRSVEWILDNSIPLSAVYMLFLGSGPLYERSETKKPKKASKKSKLGLFGAKNGV
jgi:hypothetical protein